MKNKLAIALPISAAMLFACSDGTDGKNGLDGIAGANGTSCITEPQADSSGYFVICGEDTVGTLRNGADGLPGTNGKDGARGEKGEDGKDGSKGATGANGKNCTVKDTVDVNDPSHTGIFISCEDSTEKVIWNAGDRNSDMYLDKIGICGNKIYDTTIKTCIEEELYTDLNMSKLSWTYLPATSAYGIMIDKRDMQVYKTVVIGSQTWLAENLNYNAENPKDEEGNEIYTWSWCYQNDKANCDTFGRLYTWAATMDSISQGSCGYNVSCTPTTKHRGICPEGWHVPSQAEWTTLITYVGGTSSAGTKLKSTDLWSEETKGTNNYGFTVLPASLILPDETFPENDITTTFWASDDSVEDSAYRMYFNETASSDATHKSYKSMGSAVRCIKN